MKRITVDQDGTICWFNKNGLHRENDLPSFIDVDLRVWYKNNQRHRDYGLPAYISSIGTKRWYKNGLRTQQE
jgi:hypothetical protein